MDKGYFLAWKLSLMFWWSFIWRTLFYSFLGSLIITMILGFWNGIHAKETLPPTVFFGIIETYGRIIFIPVQIWVMKTLLFKVYKFQEKSETKTESASYRIISS